MKWYGREQGVTDEGTALKRVGFGSPVIGIFSESPGEERMGRHAGHDRTFWRRALALQSLRSLQSLKNYHPAPAHSVLGPLLAVCLVNEAAFPCRSPLDLPTIPLPGNG